jgi:hypothetical protein
MHGFEGFPFIQIARYGYYSNKSFFSHSVMNTSVYQSSQDFKWLNVDWDMTSIQIEFWIVFNAFILFSYAK